MNCHGCKWLDETKHKGEGYCSMITRSRIYEPKRAMRVRYPHSERCELYEEGIFEKRFEK